METYHVNIVSVYSVKWVPESRGETCKTLCPSLANVEADAGLNRPNQLSEILDTGLSFVVDLVQLRRLYSHDMY